MVKSKGKTWVGHVHACGENRNAYNNLLGKPGRKKLMGKPRNGR